MTLALYARRKAWALEDVTVLLKHSKIHAEDCGECETKEGMVDGIDREIVLRGTLDHQQRTRLLQIADRCPIHRTLVSEIRIVTRLAL